MLTRNYRMITKQEVHHPARSCNFSLYLFFIPKVFLSTLNWTSTDNTTKNIIFTWLKNDNKTAGRSSVKVRLWSSSQSVLLCAHVPTCCRWAHARLSRACGASFISWGLWVTVLLDMFLLLKSLITFCVCYSLYFRLRFLPPPSPSLFAAALA